LPSHTKKSSLFYLIPPVLSGAAGISYEVLYGRMIADLIGDQFLVSAAVLMTFLLGIGFGAKYAHHFGNFLWMIEAGIGAYALSFLSLKPQLENFLYSTNIILHTLEGKLFICVLLLLIPAFLIGCTIPLFSEYLESFFDSGSFSSVYALYTIGSGFAALLIEFLLIRSLGIEKTVIFFAGINFIIALILKLYHASFARSSSSSSVSSPLKLPYHLFIALILSGIASSIFQLYMVKLAELLFGPFRESFALVLSLTLFGIGVGSLLVRFRKLSFQGALSLNLLGLLIIAGALEYGVSVYANLHPMVESNYSGLILLKILLLFFCMGFSTIGFGATIPALLKEDSNLAQDSGHLLFLSALANTTGFLLMVLFLHRLLEYGNQLFVILLLSTAALLFASFQNKNQMQKVIAASSFIAIIQYNFWDDNLLYLSYRSFYSTKAFKANQKAYQNSERFRSAQDVFSITKINGIPYFFINGYISIPLNSPSEKIVGALSSIFSRKTDNALVLGLGSGATAAAVGYFFQSTEVIEINPIVIKNLYRMKQWNLDIEKNPAVDIIHDDGIHYIKSTSKKYDLILNTVTTPLYFSSSKLYTMEFLKEVVTHLNPDGAYVTWIDSRIGDKGVDITLRTLQQNFKYASIFYIKSNYFLLIASQKPLSLQHPELLKTEKAAPLSNNFLEKHHLLSHWIAYNLLSNDVFSLIQNKNEALNTIDFPVLEFEMAQLGKEGFLNFKKKMLAQLNPDEIQSAFAGKQEFNIIEAMLHAENFPNNSEIALRWNELGKLKIPNLDGKHSQARMGYFKAIAQLLNTGTAHFRYAEVLDDYGLYEESIKEYQICLDLDANYPLAHFYMAASYEYQRKYRQAKTEYLKEKSKESGLSEEIKKRVQAIDLKIKAEE